MEPVFAAAEDGVNILCGDGVRRLCFPRFAGYIADYEEQRDLAGILQGRCTKCTIPVFSANNPQATIHHWRRTFKPRTWEDAMNLRERLGDDSDRLGKEFGYLPDVLPFSDGPRQPQPGCTMFDALAPDTLHQVTKNFHDRLVKQWVNEGIHLGQAVALPDLLAEIDQRMKQLPPFGGLRHFSNGISAVERWTGQEYKNLLRVYLGVIRGIADTDVVRLVKAYLDVHRLSMYRTHTDNRDCLPNGRPEVKGTLQMLEDAVSKMWDILMHPKKVWIRKGIVQPGWWAPKLHLMQHYADEIRRRGTLPQWSTENTEAFHRPIKVAYNSSNRGHSSMAYITRCDSLHFAFRGFLDELLTNWDGDNGVVAWMESTGNASMDDFEMAQALQDRFYRARYDHDRQRGVVWGAESRNFTGEQMKGYPKELHEAQDALGLPGFERATLDMLAFLRYGTEPNPRRRTLPVLDGLNDVQVHPYKQMQIVYRKHGTDDQFEAETVHCTETWAYQQNPNDVAPRHDTVLVRFDDDSGRGSTMVNRRVARIHCLFRLSVHTKGDFAYVQWFTGSNQPEADSGMFVVSKTDRYEVIQLQSIERAVHLIPDFGNEVGATRRLPQGVKSLDHYDRFVINNHIDVEAYKEIYG
jgi:hypothetical protein